MTSNIMVKKELPAEILELIFGNLQKKSDLDSCLLVCKVWSGVASDIFWDKLTVRLSYDRRIA